MPNIREITPPSDLGLRPDERASDALISSGRRIAGLYGQAAEANADTGRRAVAAFMDVGNVTVKEIEHRNVSHLAAESSKALASLDQEWNATVNKADPNDPSVAAKFREEKLEPVLEKIRDAGFTEAGQRFAEATVERYRNHFFEKTSADMSRLAGKAVLQNIETLKNQFSNAAISDPTSLKVSLDTVEHSVGAIVDSSPNLRGIDGAQLKIEQTMEVQKAIVKAAAVGAIYANPEAGVRQFSSPEYSKWISGAEVKQLEHLSKTVQNAARTDYERQQRIAKQERQDASDVRETEYLRKLHDPDPAVSAEVTARAIVMDPGLTREAQERMIGIVNRELKPETAAKVSNATAVDLIARMRAPVGDPNRIDNIDPVYDAYEKGKLSKADLKFVRDEFVNLRTPDGQALGTQQEEFIKSVKPQIDSSTLMAIDQTGAEQVYKFTMELRRKVEEYRKAGKDPRDLMDPSKPDYMGSPAAIAPYQTPMQRSMAATARALRGGGGLPPAESITGISVESPPVGTSVPKPPAPKPPPVGTIKDGWQFLGGNPGEARNWRQVGGPS